LFLNNNILFKKIILAVTCRWKNILKEYTSYLPMLFKKHMLTDPIDF